MEAALDLQEKVPVEVRRGIVVRGVRLGIRVPVEAFETMGRLLLGNPEFGRREHIRRSAAAGL